MQQVYDNLNLVEMNVAKVWGVLVWPRVDLSVAPFTNMV